MKLVKAHISCGLVGLFRKGAANLRLIKHPKVSLPLLAKEAYERVVKASLVADPGGSHRQQADNLSHSELC
ncbi:hypothetical protein D3C81_1858880 [compost metagenome]